MRASMPPKRHLLIALLLWTALLSAQVSGWTASSVYHFRNLNDTHLTGYEVNKVFAADLGTFSIGLDNRFNYTDRMQDERQQRLNDRLQLTVDGDWSNLRARAYWREEFFDRNFGFIIPAGQFMPYYEDHNRMAGVAAAFSQEKVSAEFSARYRSYSFEPVFSFSEDIDGEDLKAEAEVAMHVLKPVSFFVAGSGKFSDDTPDYDYRTAGLGLRLELPLDYAKHLQAQSRIDWRDSDVLADQSSERLIPVTHDLRYQQMLTANLAGFVSYENRCFYDRGDSEMLFNSHFLRASCKYSLAYDLSNGSFVEMGGKLSPRGKVESKSSAIFTRGELMLLQRFYLGAGVNLMPERFARYSAGVHYHFTPLNELFLDYSYTDDLEFEDFSTYASAGLRVFF
jgi:hypothetical protein